MNAVHERSNRTHRSRGFAPRRLFFSALVSGALLLSACGQEAPSSLESSAVGESESALVFDPGTRPGSQLPPRGPGRAFGGACTVDDQCGSKLCGTFERLGDVCTQACTQNAECPTGERGQKCNRLGFCRP